MTKGKKGNKGTPQLGLFVTRGGRVVVAAHKRVTHGSQTRISAYTRRWPRKR
jgi:hypothetical protein